MAADTMEALGMPRGSYVVKVNNRKVLDGVHGVDRPRRRGTMPASGSPCCARSTSSIGWDRTACACCSAPGRKDESGDFTKGAGLHEQQIADRVLALHSRQQADRRRTDDADVTLRSKRDGRLEASAPNGVAELRAIAALVAAAGYGDGRIVIDPSVVRGLEYYTGPVYEVELTFEIKDENGRPVRFGSVGGGGRYDGLVARFRGEPVPATGFSIGVSRLQAALTHLGKLDSKPEPGPVVVTVFDRDRRIADYQRMVARAARRPASAPSSISASGKFGPQMKYADKRGAPCVVIQGGDEKAKGEVQIKDLIARRHADRHQGPRRIPEEAGRGAVRGAGGQAGRGGAQGAHAPQRPMALTPGSRQSLNHAGRADGNHVGRRKRRTFPGIKPAARTASKP